MSTELTLNDLLTLEKLRIERLRAFFAESLALCFVRVDSGSRLTIYCPEPWIVDRLLEEIDALCWYSRVVVGACHLAIYFAGEEICAVDTAQPTEQSHPIHH